MGVGDATKRGQFFCKGGGQTRKICRRRLRYGRGGTSVRFESVESRPSANENGLRSTRGASWRFQDPRNENYRHDLLAEVDLPDKINSYDADHMLAAKGAIEGNLEFVPLGWLDSYTNQRVLGGYNNPDMLAAKAIRLEKRNTYTYGVMSSISGRPISIEALAKSQGVIEATLEASLNAHLAHHSLYLPPQKILPPEKIP